jgi:class 3 adenylate cyclase/CHASE2 domain-containing sensor protein
METWKRWLGHGAVTAFAVALAVLLSHNLPFLRMVENWVADYRIASLLTPEPQHSEIVVAAITEDTLQLFPYRSPVDRKFLAELLEALDAAGVRAVGLDLLFDQPTEPAKDDALKRALDGMKAPVIVSYVGTDEGLNEDQKEFLDEFVAPALRGYATLKKDAFDSAVREMFEGRDDARSFPLALASRLAPDRAFVAQPISWHGKPSAEVPAFRHFPAHTVKVMPKEWLKGKIVLVGSDLSLTDRHRTPFSVAAVDSARLMPGVDIHAHALAHLLDDRRLGRMDERLELLLTALVAALAVAVSRLPFGVAVKVGLAGALLLALWVGGFAVFAAHGVALPLLGPSLALASALWLSETLGGRDERQQKQFIKNAFGLYMSPTIVDELVRDPRKLSLGGERREMTFVFTDVAGFTTVSEKTEPAVLGVMLNRYFDGVCTIIMEQGGAVVDFIGDAVFCLFGAPVAQPDHAERGIVCARRIEAFSREFLADEAVRRTGWGITRIGVHTGAALVGNFGSGKRFKYSAVGDAVNTASRIEGLNKYFGTSVCISETTIASYGGSEGFRPLGRFTLKGKAVPVAVFEPMAADWQGEAYLTAYALMAEGRRDEALKAFAALEAAGHGDDSVAFHIARLRDGEENDVVVMKGK